MPDDSDDVGALISFQNLENVVRHIIRRFKSLEAFNEHTEAEIRGVRSEIQQRASTESLTELQVELATRVDMFNKSNTLQKDSIAAMEAQIERSRSMCSSIEKRVEACVKEKAVQDRLIRETQDGLQDKVAAAELNVFEARFAGYATKLEHQEMAARLHEYARLDVAERLQEAVRGILSRFEDYTRTAKADQQLQELRDWASNEFQQLRSRDTYEKLEILQACIRDQSISFERSHAAVDDKLRGLSDRVTSIYAELNGDLQLRALAEELEHVREGLKRYALKADQQAFQQDCIPKLRLCVDSLKAFDERLRAQDDAIQRMDEVLLDKAAKYDIVVVSAKVDQCLPREEGRKEYAKLWDEVQTLSEQLTNYIDGETERLRLCQPPDVTPALDDMSSRIALKADKADLVEMYQLKANRVDADELAKLQETIHRQLEYLAVTSFGLSKLVLTESKPGESKTLRIQQKAQVLMQSESLWTWILHNESPPNLDTLRPPCLKAASPGAGGACPLGRPSSTAEKHSGGIAPTPALGGIGVADKERREIDEQKRAALERRLGVVAAVPAF